MIIKLFQKRYIYIMAKTLAGIHLGSKKNNYIIYNELYGTG